VLASGDAYLVGCLLVTVVVITLVALR